MTNREKFKEVFGFEQDEETAVCPSDLMGTDNCKSIECKDCPFNFHWWDKEYKPCFRLKEANYDQGYQDGRHAQYVLDGTMEQIIEPCEDCISRIETQRHIYTRLYESALNNVGYECDASDVFTDIAKNRLSTWISEIPSIQPKPKMGHWIDHQEDKWIYAQCSECETVHDTRTNYCPNCGCRMVEPQEREDKE